jgi:hypothetical protein
LKGDLEVVFLKALQLLEKRILFICVIEPVFPPRFELLLNCLRKPPKCNAVWRIENFLATIGRDREDGAGLRKIMCSWKASADRGSANSAKLSASIPPPGEIHLAKSGND